jgi:hypothetical protein
MDVQFETLNYRHAEEILNSRVAIIRETRDIVEKVEGTKVGSGKDALTPRLMNAFTGRNWDKEVLVSENQEHNQFFDLLKDRVAIEIEFSRYEFLYRDYLRFLSAYNADKIDVGVLITHSQEGLSRVKHKAGAPSFARVKSDLAWLRPVVTCPIWVIGLK